MIKNDDLEDKELSITMMNKKSKRLYSRMQYGIEKKQNELNKLAEKRKRIEENAEDNNTNTAAVSNNKPNTGSAVKKTKRGNRWSAR